MKFETSNKPQPIFSFSGMTDIVMLLLIFFLLTSQFVIQTGVKVKLPGAENTEQAPPAKFIVTIVSDGPIYLGPDPVALDELPARLGILKEQHDENTLIIRADKAVPIETVIKVIDAGKGVGLDKFTIETEKTSPYQM
jgi:biopolymer transport protein ExbD